MEAKIKEIFKALNEIKLNQSKMASQINNQNRTILKLTSSVNDISKTVSKLDNENKKFSEKILKLEQRVELFEKNEMNSQDEIVAEIMERNSRINNLILFNLPETENEACLSDCDQVMIILYKMEVTIRPIGVYRIGNSSSGQPRPIKIIFSDSSEVALVMRLQNKLNYFSDYKDLRFVTDRTIKQRELLATRYQELNQRREQGENNIIIKYIMGTPRIVSNE